VANFVEQQAMARELNYKSKPLATVDEALVQNFEKGIVAGMRIAMQLPSKMMELDKEAFNIILQEERANGS